MTQKLRANAKAGFDAFKDGQLQKSKEDIFKNGLMVFFYSTVYEYIESDNIEKFFSEDDIKALADYGESILSLLYDDYLDYEEFSVATWTGVEKLIRGFIHKEDENE